MRAQKLQSDTELPKHHGLYHCVCVGFVCLFVEGSAVIDPHDCLLSLISNLVLIESLIGDRIELIGSLSYTSRDEKRVKQGSRLPQLS
jgi:hypothetical protein